MSEQEAPETGGGPAVGTLPRREPGASGYQQWLSGDLGQVRVQMFTPAMDVPPMDPDDPEAWAHVAAVIDRPHIQAIKDSEGREPTSQPTSSVDPMAPTGRTEA